MKTGIDNYGFITETQFIACFDIFRTKTQLSGPLTMYVCVRMSNKLRKRGMWRQWIGRLVFGQKYFSKASKWNFDQDYNMPTEFLLNTSWIVKNVCIPQRLLSCLAPWLYVLYLHRCRFESLWTQLFYFHFIPFMKIKQLTLTRIMQMA